MGVHRKDLFIFFLGVCRGGVVEGVVYFKNVLRDCYCIGERDDRAQAGLRCGVVGSTCRSIVKLPSQILGVDVCIR